MPLITELVQTTRAKYVGFVCDRCNKEYDQYAIEEAFHRVWTGGYSSAWGDGLSYEFIICDACSYEMFKSIAKGLV